jgi:bacillithiol biosynthesis cysteine-adding enzyme BshC
MAEFETSYMDYAATGAFSALVQDYLADEQALHPYYLHQPDLKGIEQSIISRKSFPTNRSLLVEVLKKQYAGLTLSNEVTENLNALLAENVFTVCTAHQPNLFTGPLYFVYKILHAIKLAQVLNTLHPQNRYVPVYFMGSEDADLDELGQVNVAGKKYQWQTTQKGAVGRMLVDQELITLIQELEGQLSVESFGAEMLLLLKAAYTKGKLIQQAMLELVNELFGRFGLLVLIPDQPDFKRAFQPILKQELFAGFSKKLLDKTIGSFPDRYKVQTEGRDINLFYLKDDVRERIERTETGFTISNSILRFSVAEMEAELENFPERFSPNVILRPVFQEFILPNIAFIGGGGELAYWLELRNIFESSAVPYPVLLLRNSFLLMNNRALRLQLKTGLNNQDLFRPLKVLGDELVKNESTSILELTKEIGALQEVYSMVSNQVVKIDPTLQGHAMALQTKAVDRLHVMEKKMFKAEKKKLSEKIGQLETLKAILFPEQQLQERFENFLPYYAQWGKGILDEILHHSLPWEMKFCLLKEKEIPGN